MSHNEMRRAGFLPGGHGSSFVVNMGETKVGCGCTGNAQQPLPVAQQGTYLNGIPFNPQSSWDYTLERIDGRRQAMMQQRLFHTPEQSAQINASYINGCRRC